MGFLFDFFPVLLFFIAYGFWIATGILMAASCIQVLAYWLKHRKFNKMHLISLILILILGGITLGFHDEEFLKMKPTVIYWLFAVILLGSQFIGKQVIIQRMMGSKISLPIAVWQKLNISWIIFFTLMGIANLYVVYHFSTNTWVNFKLFGTMGLTLVFVIIQAIYMARHVHEPQQHDQSP